jgi:hypothetical protein
MEGAMRAWVTALTVLLMGGWAMAKDSGTVGKGNMMHCPSAVPGAKTAQTDTKDGVELTVTAESEAATSEIRKRAEHLAAAAKTDPQSVQHTGDGHGGGGIGKCPEVLKDTVVTTDATVKGGVKITLRPEKPIDVEWLHKEVKTRLANAKK